MKVNKKEFLIVDAATQLFTDRGYAVSMDNIAKEAGVSKQTVYSYFSTKDALLERCISEKCQAVFLNPSVLDSDLPLEQVLVDFGFAFYQFLLGKEACSIFKVSVSLSHSHPELARIYLAAGPEKTNHTFKQFLLQRWRRGEIKADADIDVATTQFLMMCHGRGVIHKQLNHTVKESDEQIRQYIQHCAAMFLAYWGA